MCLVYIAHDHLHSQSLFVAGCVAGGVAGCVAGGVAGCKITQHQDHTAELSLYSAVTAALDL